MSQIKINHGKKTSSLKQVNTIESLKNLSYSGNGVNPNESFFDEFFPKSTSEKNKTQPQRKEFSIFNYNNYYETEVVKRQIKELIEQVRKEISFIKKADTALAADLKDIERISLESLPDKPGIYHVRFLEIVLRILKSLREKIGESRTWLSAMVSRKKKRGSLFAVLSKKKGTQYSLSQELTNARSIQ